MSNEATALADRLLNTQLYENSPLSCSIIERDYKASPDRLFNDRDPNFAILSEKPEHRLLIFLKSQGLSNTEIAQRTGYQLAWVGQVLRQPWARERIVQELSEAGRDAVAEAIRSSALDSVHKLIDLRDTAPPAVAKSACDSLLDRFLGKPIQHVEQKIEQRTGKLQDVAAIDAEIARLQTEEKQLLGNAKQN